MTNYRRTNEKAIRAAASSRSRDSYCLTGPMMPGWGFEKPDGSEDTAALKSYWEKHRERLLVEWIRRQPGTRPWFWWQFIGHKHGRRERIDGKVHPFDNPLRSLVVANTNSERAWRRAYSLRFGMPAIHIPPHDDDVHRDFMQNVLLGKESTIFEPEWSFLVRHGLLVDEDSP